MKISIGCDIEDISRFKDKSETFLNRIYTKNEIEYCKKFSNPAPHFCARYCAKEAVVKALNDFKIKDVYYSDIEILNNSDGACYVVIKKYNDLSIKISMSHCKNYATASVIIYKD